MADLGGVEIKLARARDHYQVFDVQWRAWQKARLYRFIPEVHDRGAKHIYRALKPASIPDAFAAVVGDFVHNLRSALDHLAWELVKLNGGKPSEATQFPIRASRISHNVNSQVANPTAVAVSGGVSAEALKRIEAVQPYTNPRGHDLDLLWQLHRLDVIDKHRHLVLHATAVHSVSQGGGASDTANLIFTKHPLKDRRVVLVVTYPTPRQEPDPEVRLHPTVVFGKGAPKALMHVGVDGTMINLYARVEDVIGTFRDLFNEGPQAMPPITRLLHHAPTPTTVEEGWRKYFAATK